jgi:hypothetical protein
MGGISAGVLEAVLPLSRGLFLGSDGRLQWETLVAGLGAGVAAYFTIRHLNQQIRQTQKLADDRRERRARAARATLPLALSELAEYSISCIKELYDIRPCFKTDGIVDQKQREQRLSVWALPSLSENILSSLKECIEFVDDAPAQAITLLIQRLQIQRSRLRGYISRARGTDKSALVLLTNIESAMYDVAEVHARTSTIFPFARGYPTDSSYFIVTRNRVYEAFSLAGCFHDYDDISTLADKWQREARAREEVEQGGVYFP